MNARNFATTVLAFSAVCGNALAMPNLVINGGFETDTFGSPFVTLPPAPTGWSIDSGTIDGIRDYWQAANGTNQSIDLFGNSRGEISQTISTVAGQSYAVSYYQSYNPDFNDPSVGLVLDITGTTLGSVAFSSALSFGPAHTRADMQWQLVSTSFVAQDAFTKISFSGVSSSDRNIFFGPALDEVNVSAVPLPGVLGLMLVGLAGIGFSKKRRD